MSIYKQINLIMSEIGAISKDRSGEGIKYSFRGIEDVLNNFHPLLIKHSVFCAPKVIKESTETFINKSGTTTFRVTLTVEHHFFALDGTSVCVTTSGEGIDTSDKGTGKAMSTAFKYAFFQLFCVPTAQCDDGADLNDCENDQNDANIIPPASPPIQGKVTPHEQVMLGRTTLPLITPKFSSGGVNDWADQIPPPHIYDQQPSVESVPHQTNTMPISGALAEKLDPRHYVVKFGKKWKGKTLSDMGREEVAGYSAWLVQKADEEGKELKGDAAEFISVGDDYLRTTR